jgi:hypothetical protein
MKKLLLKLSILILPIAVIVISTNYFVDPANVLQGEMYLQKIANILQKVTM